MDHTARAACLVLVALTTSARATEPPPTDDAFEWAVQAYGALRPTPPEPVELQVVATFPDLAALADSESWECRPNDSGADCLRSGGRATLGGDVEEVRVVGFDIGEACFWKLLVKVPEGWLQSHELGISPVACGRPPRANESVDYYDAWFPLGVTQAGSAVRFEAQGVSEGKVVRRATLCQVVPGGLACAEERAATKLAPNGRLIATDARLLPLTAAAEVGVTRRAHWFGRPTTSGRPLLPGAAYAYGPSRVRRVALAPAGPHVTVIDGGEVKILLERADRPVSLERFQPYAANEQVNVLGIESDAAPGVVRVALELRNKGKNVVSWRKDVIVRLLPGGDGRVQVVQVATGCDVRTPDGPSGWSRDVVVSADGLRLLESDVPLAWFRSVGDYAWSALPAAFERAQRSMARALHAAESAEPPLADGELRTFTGGGRLTLVPGYIEPVSRAIFDTTREL